MKTLILFVGVLSLVFLCSRHAEALENQLIVGGSLDYALEFDDELQHGGGVGVHSWFGLTDAVAIGGRIAYAAHAAPNDEGDNELRNVITAAAGLYFVLDIIRVIPYAGVLIGAAVEIEDDVAASYLMNVCIGADVIITATLTSGLEVSYQALIGDDILPARLVISARMSWRHLFF